MCEALDQQNSGPHCETFSAGAVPFRFDATFFKSVAVYGLGFSAVMPVLTGAKISPF